MSLLGASGLTVCFLRTIWCCLRLLNRAFNMHSIVFLLRATKPEWKLALKRPRYLCLQKPRKCMLQVSGIALQQVEKFKYLGVVFTSGERRNKEIATLTGKANAVLCELHRSLFTKRELSNTTKLSVFKSLFVRSTQSQAAKICFEAWTKCWSQNISAVNYKYAVRFKVLGRFCQLVLRYICHIR